ncbi:MAG: geranylgeranylglycerol-phosphate geranylgeranyltransferase [Flavobacteriaceae bacterium]
MIKFFSLFSVIRGYNILVLILAQYLTSIYILSKKDTIKEVLFDLNLFLIVLASSLCIASGYIINNFYDSEKDLINRPIKSKIDRFVSQNTKLSIYFVLNFLAIVFASYVSFRAVIFFSGYIFLIWLYSHKIKKMIIVGNIMSSILTVAPFFAILVYYKNFEIVIFFHALFLTLNLLAKEILKDLENIKGDFLINYKTVPVVYGERFSKRCITLAIVFAMLSSSVLLIFYDLGTMIYYFKSLYFIYPIFFLSLYFSSKKKHFKILHNFMKLILIIGVCFIPFIEF